MQSFYLHTVTHCNLRHSIINNYLYFLFPLQLEGLNGRIWLRPRVGKILRSWALLVLLPYTIAISATRLPICFSTSGCLWGLLQGTTVTTTDLLKWYWISGTLLSVAQRSHVRGTVWLTAWRRRSLTKIKLKSSKRTYAYCSFHSTHHIIFTLCSFFLYRCWRVANGDKSKSHLPKQLKFPLIAHNN